MTATVRNMYDESQWRNRTISLQIISLFIVTNVVEERGKYALVMLYSIRIVIFSIFFWNILFTIHNAHCSSSFPYMSYSNRLFCNIIFLEWNGKNEKYEIKNALKRWNWETHCHATSITSFSFTIYYWARKYGFYRSFCGKLCWGSFSQMIHLFLI